MRKNTNPDGSTSYTLTQGEKVFIASLVAYFWGRRSGYYNGRRSVLAEIEKTGLPLNS